MSDENTVHPALTPEEWERGAYYVPDGECVDNDNNIFTVEGHEPFVDEYGITQWRLTDRVDVERPDKLMAMCNFALPDGHPLKITREDVDAIDDAADIMRRGLTPDPERIRALGVISDKLAALLPPEGT